MTTLPFSFFKFGKLQNENEISGRITIRRVLAQWPKPCGGQNPRRHPRSPLVYTYKDREYLLKK